MVDSTQPAAAEPAPGLDPKAAKLRGVGGWLAFFLLSCFLGPFILAGRTILGWSAIPASQMDALTTLVPAYAVARGFEITGSVVVGFGLLATGLAVVQQRPWAALLAATVLSLLLAFNVSDILLAEWAAWRLIAVLRERGVTLPRESVEDLAGALRALAAALIWLWYFFRSRRVRATFGPVTWRRVAAWIGGRLPETGAPPEPQA